MHIKEAIAKDLDIPEVLINDAIRVARSHVKIFTIPKKNGEDRKIYHPSKKLKTIQYWLIRSVCNQLNVHESSMAYREGISILDNANKHRFNRFFLKMDLENFFPSISFDDFIPILRKWHDTAKPDWDLDSEAEEIIRKVCFYKDDQLVIGYPSSPVISNIVMYDFDLRVCSLLSGEQYGEVAYTRYADDLIFSTNTKGVCLQLKNHIQNLIKETESPKIRVNHAKTRLGSSTGGSASVTGLKICAAGHITIHKKQKDHIRLLLGLYKKDRLPDEEVKSLIGHLSYCHYVAPDFYTKLSKKYFNEIHKLHSKE